MNRITQDCHSAAFVSFHSVNVTCELKQNQDWTLGLVFELCEGGSVHKFLHGENNAQGQTVKRDVPDAVRLGWARDVAAGVAFIHSTRLLHRDLRYGV